MGIKERIAARHLGQPVPQEEGRAKTAAFPPQEEESAGQRNIPKDHEFNKKALKPLSKALWACAVAQGHALTAYRQVSRLKSTTVSPDGLLGGRGYTMALKDIRQKLHEAAESLSSISDTLYDEATAPHWKPKLSQLDEGDAGDVTRFIEEAGDVLEDPEADSQEKIEEIEKEDNSDKAPKKEDVEGAEEDSSSLPSSGDAQSEPEPKREQQTKTASATATSPLWTSEALELDAGSIFVANSSVSPDSLSGPRVDDIGPGGGDGTYGEFNDDSAVVDDWSADGGGLSRRDDAGEDYDYPSEWENDLSRSAWLAEGAASLPDSSTDTTETDAYDFGIGYGAKGQGVQHTNPSGEGNGDRGVLGPQSGLPGTPPSSSGDTTRLVVDDKLNERQSYDALMPRSPRYSEGVLPQDVAGPPARRDEANGIDNGLATFSTSEVPGDDQANGTGGQPLVDTYYTQEDTDTEYVRYDYSTRDLRDQGNHPGQNGGEPWAPDGEATR